MLKRIAWVMAGILLLAPSLFQAQEPAPKREAPELPLWAETVIAYLGVVGDKTVTIAEDFPDELYNTFRPGKDPAVRTAAEVLLHVAFVNERMAFRSGTEEQKQAYVEAHGGPPNVLNFRFTSKAETVARVRESFAAIREHIQNNPDPAYRLHWMQALTHSNEHYGNLVVYYRANNLVPPASRQ